MAAGCSLACSVSDTSSWPPTKAERFVGQAPWAGRSSAGTGLLVRRCETSRLPPSSQAKCFDCWTADDGTAGPTVAAAAPEPSSLREGAAEKAASDGPLVTPEAAASTSAVSLGSSGADAKARKSSLTQTRALDENTAPESLLGWAEIQSGYNESEHSRGLGQPAAAAAAAAAAPAGECGRSAAPVEWPDEPRPDRLREDLGDDPADPPDEARWAECGDRASSTEGK